MENFLIALSSPPNFGPQTLPSLSLTISFSLSTLVEKLTLTNSSCSAFDISLSFLDSYSSPKKEKVFECVVRKEGTVATYIKTPNAEQLRVLI